MSEAGEGQQVGEGDIFSFSILRKVVVEGAQVIVKGKGRHLFMASELTSRLVCVKD